MAGIKSLAKDTAVYGLSSIIGKFLNWLLVPFYSYTLKETGDYGMVTELYGWTALALVILTYGMETGFFRFINNDKYPSAQVYSTSLSMLGLTSLLFVFLGLVFLPGISAGMGYQNYPEFIGMLVIVVAADAFCSIPFAYLRYKNKALRFASLKLLMIFSNIFFNLFFIWLCPRIYEWNPALIDWFYKPDYGVGYVFVSNLLSTGITLLALLPYFIKVKFDFNPALLRKMLSYSLPLLLLGIAGIMNQTFDKIIFKHLFEDQEYARAQLGIYGACYKIAVVMMMFTQAFRYAYEPYIFAKHRDGDNRQAYAEAMKYYIIFAFLVFLGVMFYLDIFKYIISTDYHEGLMVVPIVLMCYLFQGVFFNLSLWYKLTDRTRWGAYISMFGALITILGNILFVPRYGYVAAAWVSFVCFLLMMLISWWLGQKYYPIHYDLKSAGAYLLLTLGLYALGMLLPIGPLWLKLLFRTVLLLIFLLILIKKELPLSQLLRAKLLHKKE
ncbi:MAG: polysaccharide biosynthesis C-terminal domain-containing protein [Bacteroidales bacterium]|nr:polysaccharide biosynthesis C-terminal domain-containing protein [Bacteroidales bacterium]MDD3431167.1 polysaccharide biosynthesis C-terminal domain-containing protein [Bacteroidales bacterium]MDD4361329.1 polysaccharide biosynthesis C-terminal domain-containing protein [Bacteroidales bacterium]MDD4431145.1 polysaccharide biosynthesis C-terminal domain-containing protein [Bacteroidales bacterium]